MKPEEPLLPDDSPDLTPRSSSLDPSEEEALLRHLSRYQARKVRRRQGNRLLAAGTVVAGAGVILVVVALARSPRPEAPPLLPTPAVETDVLDGRAISRPAVRPERPVTATDPVASATPSGGETAATTAAPRPPTPTAPAPPTPTSVAPPPATTAPATRPSPGPPVPAAPSSPPAPALAAVAYQPRDRLTLVRPGDSKDKVFDRFGTTFEQRGGSVVRIDGMRLRASGRSPRYAHVEVAEVTLANAATGQVHWFLFGDGHLLAWGRPEEWRATVQRYEIEIDYPPAAPGGR